MSENKESNSQEKAGSSLLTEISKYLNKRFICGDIPRSECLLEAKYVYDLVYPLAFAAGEKSEREKRLSLPAGENPYKDNPAGLRATVWNLGYSSGLEAQAEKDRQGKHILEVKITSLEATLESLRKALLEARKAGAKELAGWIDKRSYHGGKVYKYLHLEIGLDEWQSKLKSLEEACQ